MPLSPQLASGRDLRPRTNSKSRAHQNNILSVCWVLGIEYAQMDLFLKPPSNSPAKEEDNIGFIFGKENPEESGIAKSI